MERKAKKEKVDGGREGVRRRESKTEERRGDKKKEGKKGGRD